MTVERIDTLLTVIGIALIVVGATTLVTWWVVPVGVALIVLSEHRFTRRQRKDTP